jgi:enamine deaminase RidA (YjgF/YER057c/UK114 family)
MSKASPDLSLQRINPESLPRPRGFAHGVLAPAGCRILAVAGQTAADADGRIARLEFVDQFDVALGRVVDVVRAAGGRPEQIVRMTVYVTDLDSYRASRGALREVWVRHMGRYFPAMALVGVSALVDRDATVEIAADAALPETGADK